ncbi:Uncharacterized protein AXF42_Ash004604 [Apostasia shenzhenica]|uniref:Uncharacterized protein n=1 Tax=Apostasia shenzhenica TaxID=1088818 RepID=A0A2I0BH49_9ASPA|nr:Uncharacterized protein AXF42_Ash004604 [Apostasia shenzhenica]
MDQILNKFGSYWFTKRANKEISSVGDDINSLQSSIEGGAKWLVNKLKASGPHSLLGLSLIRELCLMDQPSIYPIGIAPGKMQKPLPDLLREYDLPAGIFPRDATNYEFNEETSKLTVLIPSVCEVGYKDSSILRFLTSVTGYLEKGKLSDIEGVKTKVLIWTKVTAITTEGSKVHFNTGVKKTRSRDAYEVLRDGVIVDKF